MRGHREAEPVSSGDSQGRAAFEDWFKTEIYRLY